MGYFDKRWTRLLVPGPVLVDLWQCQPAIKFKKKMIPVQVLIKYTCMLIIIQTESDLQNRSQTASSLQSIIRQDLQVTPMFE